MENSRNKRGYEEGIEDAGYLTETKKPKLPALASVIVEVLKVDSMQRLSSSLEPMLRRIVSAEVERALTRIGNGQLTARFALLHPIFGIYAIIFSFILFHIHHVHKR
ncbi:calmodulin-binding protein 60 E-like [Hibiscus syriacus]|uniref:calmodulin-binding protein 60 E-like n=1 Tax=Hibiscus syriacus TaxID=106335 RepID=UPI001924B028|nr:calmodulin-binding protein 60 E-like [Hibiscus syriacus]